MIRKNEKKVARTGRKRRGMRGEEIGRNWKACMGKR